MTALDVKKALSGLANKERATTSRRYFKTGKGQYGEDDVFIGVSMPDCRKIAKTFKHLPLNEIQKLLDSEIHEDRMVGVVIMANKYSKVPEIEQKRIFDLYLKNVHENRINNCPEEIYSIPLNGGLADLE